MTESEKRENGRRSYDLALAMLRWDMLKRRYAGEKQLRRGGQRAAFANLREHATMMLRENV